MIKDLKAKIQAFLPKHRRDLIVGALGFIISQIISGYPLITDISNRFSPKFTMFTTGFSKSAMGPFNLVCQIGPHGSKRFSLDFAVAVEIVNISEKPKRIIYYNIEEKTLMDGFLSCNILVLQFLNKHLVIPKRKNI